MHEDQLEPNAVSPSLNSLTKQGEKKRNCWKKSISQNSREIYRKFK